MDTDTFSSTYESDTQKPKKRYSLIALIVVALIIVIGFAIILSLPKKAADINVVDSCGENGTFSNGGCFCEIGWTGPNCGEEQPGGCNDCILFPTALEYVDISIKSPNSFSIPSSLTKGPEPFVWTDVRVIEGKAVRVSEPDEKTNGIYLYFRKNVDYSIQLEGTFNITQNANKFRIGLIRRDYLYTNNSSESNGINDEWFTFTAIFPIPKPNQPVILPFQPTENIELIPAFGGESIGSNILCEIKNLKITVSDVTGVD